MLCIERLFNLRIPKFSPLCPLLGGFFIGLLRTQMMTLRLGKKVNDIKISVDDLTYAILMNLSHYDQKKLTTYCAQVIEEAVHGRKIRLCDSSTVGNENNGEDE